MKPPEDSGDGDANGNGAPAQTQAQPFAGVAASGHRFRAFVQHQGVEHDLGEYNSPEAAARAHDRSLVALGLVEANFPPHSALRAFLTSVAPRHPLYPTAVTADAPPPAGNGLLGEAAVGRRLFSQWPLSNGQTTWCRGRVTRYRHSDKKHNVAYDGGESAWDRIEGPFARPIEWLYPEPPAAVPLGPDAVGRKLTAEWILGEGEVAWYKGTVMEWRESDGHHKVEYDDGDVEWDIIEGPAVTRAVQWLADDGTAPAPPPASLWGSWGAGKGKKGASLADDRLGPAAVGRELEAEWSLPDGGEKRWYKGTVIEWRAGDGRHRVKYIDGDESWDRLDGTASRTYRWLDASGQPVGPLKRKGEPPPGAAKTHASKKARLEAEGRLGASAVGRWIKAEWSLPTGGTVWYEGRIAEWRESDGRFRVEYEDGDEAWDRLEPPRAVTRKYVWLADAAAAAAAAALTHRGVGGGGGGDVLTQAQAAGGVTPNDTGEGDAAAPAAGPAAGDALDGLVGPSDAAAGGASTVPVAVTPPVKRGRGRPRKSEVGTVAAAARGGRGVIESPAAAAALALAAAAASRPPPPLLLSPSSVSFRSKHSEWEPNVWAENSPQAFGLKRYLRFMPPGAAPARGIKKAAQAEAARISAAGKDGRAAAALAAAAAAARDTRPSRRECFCSSAKVAASSARGDPWADAIKLVCPGAHCGTVPIPVRVGSAGVFPAAKGRGVFALEPISQGTRIFEYTGEVMPAAEMDKRTAGGGGTCANGGGRGGGAGSAEAQELAGLGLSSHVHFYAVNLTSGDVLDASREGSVARFANHSCDPNLDSEEVQDPHRGLHIVMFAKRDIPAGEELTVDYRQDKQEGGGGRGAHRPTLGLPRTRCQCLAPTCRGFIF